MEKARYGRGRGRGRGQNRHSDRWPENAFDSRSRNASGSRDDFRGQQRHFPRPGRRPGGRHLGYRRLQELANTESSEIAISLLQCRESLKVLVNSEEIKEDWITLLIEILGKMCDTDMTANLLEVMSIFKDSSFLRTHLSKYILQFPLIQEDLEKSQVKLLMECLIAFFKEWLVRFPRSCYDIPIDNLLGIVREMEGEDVLVWRKQIEKLLAKRRDLIDKERKEDPKKPLQKTKRPKLEPPPPDDFRKLSIYPSTDEIRSNEPPFLRRNKVSEGYKDLGDYLDVQFRLLREDFVSPLREGIKEIVKKISRKERSQNLHIYENVEILHTVCTRSGMVHCIRLDMSGLRNIPWEHSKRLLYGSFLCLSKNNFETMVFATVANRKAEDLRAGKLEIRFVGDIERTPITRGKFVMVESPAYFESYRPILERLKEIKPDSFPFQDYLVHCRRDVALPKYLLNNETRYDLRETLELVNVESARNVSIVDPQKWPPTTCLNASQLESLKAALTKEFTVIQGPPGTGKTYVGLKIVRALLDNRHVWEAENRSTMLMVCYTNHALDQFLEGVLKFQQVGVIRVGGRSSEQLQPYNIHEYTTSSTNRMHVLSDMRKCQEAIDTAKTRLANSKYHILWLRDLKDFAGKRHFEQLKAQESTYSVKGMSVLQRWLGLKPRQSHDIQSQKVEATQPISGKSDPVNMEDDDAEEGIEVDNDADVIQRQRYLGVDDFQLIQGTETNANQKRAHHSSLSSDHLKLLRGESSLRPLTTKEITRVLQVWDLTMEDRWRLYLFWLRLFQASCREDISRATKQYEVICKRFAEVREHEELHALREAVVIGMTTTGAAKYRTVLEHIKPTIVVVEEAAEVLEAHIITSLTKCTQHLILIGDHKQLRPNPTVYNLAKEYNLDVSLFERMVNSGMHCYSLSTQHRMRPEIAAVMRFIYEDLQNHESVENYQDVRGVSTNMFFIDHRHPEDESELNDRLKSHSNPHEAQYVAALCEYFLLQGYAPQQITVLTMYSGQVLALKRTMPKSRFQGVRVTAVDNFQGEENDIILLSLVRSNKQRKIGFLGVNNRVCVALSRAREGLFCIGDFALLAEKSALWRDIVKYMRGQGAVGESLQLVCANHPERRIYAKVAEDFKQAPEGGCTMPCHFRLPCGHVCERACHPDDNDHELYSCRKNCFAELCVKHQSVCNKKCHFGEECGGCPVQVVKTIPICGHTQLVPCGKPLETFQCQEKCFKSLPCEHDCPGQCWEDCQSFKCQVIVRKEFACSHNVEKPCWELSEGYRCVEPCSAVLECEHPCPGNCYDCRQGRMHVPCQAKCDRQRVCLHPCTEPCTKNCPPCPEECKNRCIHSKCPKKCMELCTPCRERCSWRCPHFTCTRLCGEKCNRPRCNEPCRKRLRSSCNHPCIGLCGEPCPQLCRICHRDVVTEIFFGNEEDSDARFIELLDCGHVFEVNAMDYWMDKDTGYDDSEEAKDIDIKLKVCPRCKTPIRRSFRYADIVKEKLADVEAVKKRLINEEKEFLLHEARLKRNLRALGRKYPDIHRSRGMIEEADEVEEEHQYSQEWRIDPVSSESSYSCMEHWLRQRRTMGELRTLENQINLLEEIYKVHEDIKVNLLTKTTLGLPLLPATSLTVANIRDQKCIQTAREVEKMLDRLEQDLLKFQISSQRLTDIRDEVIWVDLRLKFHVIQCELVWRFGDVTDEQREWLNGLDTKLSAGRRLTSEDVSDIEAEINHIRSRCGLGVISEKERIMIVKAMGFSQGHWYKCPNGHIYAIGECGGAMEKTKCPECSETIGGEHHNLIAGNQVATEMDGAKFPAWSEQANLQNYDPDELRHFEL